MSRAEIPDLLDGCSSHLVMRMADTLIGLGLRHNEIPGSGQRSKNEGHQEAKNSSAMAQ